MSWGKEDAAHSSAVVRSRHQDNRRAWNEGAQSYTADNERRVQLLREGKSNLHPVERANLERIGPLEAWCERAVHLQCASGYDTLSLLLEGAHEVIGIDISDVHIENARWTGEKLGLPATWHCCDVLDTPTELDGSADLVYTRRGALPWLHDLEGWAAVVARLLKPGGVFSLLEDHPVTWLFSQDTETLTPSGNNYFTHAEWNKGWPGSYIGELDVPTEAQTAKHERLWKLADVFNTLVGAGLNVTYLGEHPDAYWDAFPKLSPEEKAKIPMTFSVLARKPA
jgi:SAM-dependent methyltransferase